MPLKAVSNRFWFLSVFVGLLTLATPVRADETTRLMAMLNEPGVFAFMRHALAPGMGDPQVFKLRDCSTQRNLSDAGRRQSEKIGEVFRAHGISQAHVFSSQWCRCLETAKLLGLGEIRELPAINSFFQDFSNRDPQTRELRRWLTEDRPDGPVLLVSHQVNITALADVFAQSGEIIFLRLLSDGVPEVLGRLKTDWD